MFGLPEEDFAAPDAFAVHPQNWDAVCAFVAAQTQWRLGPRGGLAGLDYTGARAAADGLGLRWKAVFPGVRVMEAEVLAAQAEAA